MNGLGWVGLESDEVGWDGLPWNGVGWVVMG